MDTITQAKSYVLIALNRFLRCTKIESKANCSIFIATTSIFQISCHVLPKDLHDTVINYIEVETS